jgi:predicted transcriptional regulator
MQATNVKQQVQILLNSLPDSATWEDVMYWIYVRQAIDAGLEDSKAGRTIDIQEVRNRFGLSQ